MGLIAWLVGWLVHALIVMASVAVVSPGNPRNTIGRALVVTALVAVLVTPFGLIWWLILPGLIALFAWWAVYKFAYDIGLFRSLLAGIVQALFGAVLDWWIRWPSGPSGTPPGAI